MSGFDPLLRLRNVSLARAGLHGLSFDLAAGQFLALLGPGTSAVLALLAGLATPDSGEIRLGGADLAGVPPHRRGLGLVSARADLFAHLTLAENIALPLHARGLAARRRQVARLLDLFRLRGAAALYPPALSPLETARAALARALAGAPLLLLLDDPWDPLTAITLAADLARLREQLGFAAILATNDGPFARAWADEIAVLADGRLAQIGSPRTLYDRPVSAAVAAATGVVSCLPGRLRAIEDDLAVVELACGPVVEAMLADAGPVGTACEVLMRPERVALAAGNAAELGEGAVPAKIRSIRDSGDHVMIDLQVGQTRFPVRRPAAPGLIAGRDAAIAWQAHDAWACRPNE